MTDRFVVLGGSSSTARLRTRGGGAPAALPNTRQWGSGGWEAVQGRGHRELLNGLVTTFPGDTWGVINGGDGGTTMKDWALDNQGVYSALRDDVLAATGGVFEYFAFFGLMHDDPLSGQYLTTLLANIDQDFSAPGGGPVHVIAGSLNRNATGRWSGVPGDDLWELMRTGYATALAARGNSSASAHTYEQSRANNDLSHLNAIGHGEAGKRLHLTIAKHLGAVPHDQGMYADSWARDGLDVTVQFTHTAGSDWGASPGFHKAFDYLVDGVVIPWSGSMKLSPTSARLTLAALPAGSAEELRVLYGNEPVIDDDRLCIPVDNSGLGVGGGLPIQRALSVPGSVVGGGAGAPSNPFIMVRIVRSFGGRMSMVSDNGILNIEVPDADLYDVSLSG